MAELNRSDVPHGEFSGQLAQMVTEGWTGRVTTGIQAAISASFKTDQVIRPVLTQNETRRRFRICVSGFCIMRRDLGWAVPRIIEELPVYLRCQLDGMDWSPDEDRDSWLSTDTEPMKLDGADQAPEIGDVAGAFEASDLDPDG